MDEQTFIKECSKTGETLADLLVYEAKQFWERAGFTSDFCIQSFSGIESGIVFGGWNRVVWHLRTGFRMIESHCSERFMSANDEWCKRG